MGVHRPAGGSARRKNAYATSAASVFMLRGAQGRGEYGVAVTVRTLVASGNRLSQRGVAHFLSLLFAKLRELFLQPRVVVG